MITAANVANVYDLRGLSTDTKPTEKVGNGSTFLEIDTSKLFAFDEANKQWREISIGSGGGGGGGEIVLPNDTAVWYINDVKVDTIDDVGETYIAFTDPDGTGGTLEFTEDPETGGKRIVFYQDKGGGEIVTDPNPKITICYYSNDASRKTLAFNAINEYVTWYLENN